MTCLFPGVGTAELVSNVDYSLGSNWVNVPSTSASCKSTSNLVALKCLVVALSPQAIMLSLLAILRSFPNTVATSWSVACDFLASIACFLTERLLVIYKNRPPLPPKSSIMRKKAEVLAERQTALTHCKSTINLASLVISHKKQVPLLVNDEPLARF